MATTSRASFSVGGASSRGGTPPAGGRGGRGGAGRATASVLSIGIDASQLEEATRKIRRAAKDNTVSLTFDERAFLKSWNKIKQEAKKAFTSAQLKAAEASFSSTQIRKLTSTYETSMRQIDEARLRTEKLAADLRARAAKGLETRELSTALLVERKKLDGLKQRFGQEMKQTKLLAERRLEFSREADERASQHWSKSAEDAANTFESHMERLKRGEGIGDLFKTLGRRAEVGSIQAARKVQAGEGGKKTEAVANILGKVGPALAAVGAVAAALGVLVKMMIDADEKMKEMNRTLLESGVTAGDVAKDYENAGDAIDKVRKTFTGGEGAFSFNRIWGTDAKDHLQVLGAYAEAGLTMKEITANTRGAGEEMDKLRQATATALTWSKLLGQSSQETATNIASYMEDLGLTLQGVSERFASIEVAARGSGFGVKRFFGQVLQATSGLSMYNVRLEEAASLLKDLGKALGPKGGAEFLQNLTRGFGEEGITERYKKLLLTGGKSGEVFGRETLNTLQDFSRKLKDLPEAESKAITQALASAGVNLQGSPEKIIEQMRRLSARQRSGVLTRAEIGGANSNILGQLGNLLSLAGARGVTGQAGAIGQLGAGANLNLLLNAANSYLPGKRLDEFSFEQRAGFESTSGISGQLFEQLKRVGSRFQGQDQRLAEIQKAVRQGKPYDSAEAERMARTIGVYVDREGKRRRISLREGEAFTPGAGVVIGDKVGDLIQSAGKELEDIARDQLPRSEQLALEMVRNTTDVSKILEQGVVWWLEQIYSVTQGIYNIIGSEDERRNRQNAMEALTQEIDRAHNIATLSERRVADLEAQARAATTPQERADLLAQAKEERDRGSVAAGRAAALTTVRKKVYAQPTGFKFFWEDKKSREQFLDDAVKAAGQEAIEAAQKAGVTGSATEVLGKVGLQGRPLEDSEWLRNSRKKATQAVRAASQAVESAANTPEGRTLGIGKPGGIIAGGGLPDSFFDPSQRVPASAGPTGAPRAGARAGAPKTINNHFYNTPDSIMKSVDRRRQVVGG